MTTAANIIDKARRVLNDTDATNYRNTDAELLGWLNSGLIQLSTVRPAACSETRIVNLVAGARQVVPSDANQLLDVIRNTNGNAVNRTEREYLDLLDPAWPTEVGVTTIQNWMYDTKKDMRAYYVYPPAEVGAKLDLLLAVPPATMAATTDVVPVDDFYINALENFVVGKALSKETEDAGLLELAAAYLKAFVAEVGE